MKKVLTTILLFLVVIFSVHSQKSNYSRGFESGFKEGYCYNQYPYCSYPIQPLAPLPRINESKDSYQDGYNRGFQFGLDLVRSKEALEDLDYTLQVKTIKFNDYIQQNPVDAMVAVGMIKQSKYDTRVAWVQNRIDQLRDLMCTLINEQTMPTVGISVTREYVWKDVANYSRSIAGVDFSNDFQFNLVKSKFNKLEQAFYEYYDGVTAAIIRDQQASNSTTSYSASSSPSSSSSSSSSNYNSNLSNIKVGYLTKINPDSKMLPPLRDLPEADSEIIYNCPLNASVYVIEKTNELFYKVTVNGNIGYIHKYFLNQDGNDYGEPSTSSSNSSTDLNTSQFLFITSFDSELKILPPLRAAPDSQSRIIYKCPINSSVYVIEKTNPLYFKVKINGHIGYINQSFLNSEKIK